MTELPRQSYFVRAGEPLMDAAVRVATDAVYYVRDHGGSMHEAGARAASEVFLLIDYRGYVLAQPGQLRNPPVEQGGGQTWEAIGDVQQAILNGETAEAIKVALLDGDMHAHPKRWAIVVVYGWAETIVAVCDYAHHARGTALALARALDCPIEWLDPDFGHSLAAEDGDAA